MMGAFADAWADELASEPFAELPDAEAAVRSAAFVELRSDPVAAIWSIEYPDVDEIYAVLSWVDDPTIWPSLSVRRRLDVMRGDQPTPEPTKCGAKVGSKPWWMGSDQYDPCRCLLTTGHDGEHRCEHTITINGDQR